MRTDKLEVTISRWQDGYEDALTVLMSEFSPRLKGFIQIAVPNWFSHGADTEDVLQETWIKADRSMRSERFEYRGKKEFVAWLKSIASNTVVDMIRSQNRKKNTPEFGVVVGDVELDGLEEWVDNETASRIVRAKEFRNLILQAIDELPEKEGYAVSQRMRGVSAQDIAAKMNLNKGTIDRILNRGREKLTQYLDALSRGS